MTSERAYDIAFDFHINKKDLTMAAAMYKLILKNFPNTTQARFADTKLDSLKAKGIDTNSLPSEIIDMAEQIFNGECDVETMAQLRDKKLEQLKYQRDKEKYKDLLDRGLDHFYEYKAITIFDKNGVADVNKLTDTMNKMALKGWRLKTAVSNEVGKEAFALGLGGFTSGTNSTIDQTVLIFERKVKLDIE